MTDAKQDWNDEDAWLRLADGQLDAATLRDLVAACEREPQLWKRCAITLLEEQVMQQEMKALKDSPLGSDAGDWSPAFTSRSIASAPPVAAPRGTDQSSVSRSAATGWLNNLALVASVLVAFMIGWQSSQRWGITLQPGQSVSPSYDSGTSLVTASPQVRDQDSHTPQVVSRNANEALLASEQIDSLNTQNFANVMQAKTDPELQRRTEELRRRGYDVRTKSGAVPVILPDGRPAIVPFDQLNVFPPRYPNAY